MKIKDIINKKKNNEIISYEELSFAFNGYLNKLINDEEMTMLLRAICDYGMNYEETYHLTDIFIKSGDILDLSDIPGIKVDKHSTGGVGDKTTLVIVPIVAACDVYIPKISGRGLGFTGGTVDKLEAIPGFRVELNEDEFKKYLIKNKGVICTQTSNIAPMDKAIYALRDVTNTVESIPLIASSIMSKKIALGADKILIDLKLGRGALIKNEEDAKKLTEYMKNIGSAYQKEVNVIISNMDIPLGDNVGNALEIIEAIDILKGKENDLSKLCIKIATNLIMLAKGISYKEARKNVIECLNSGKALAKFNDIVETQGGNLSQLKVSEKIIEVKSKKEGILTNIDALTIGKFSVDLGAGRKSKEDNIDHSVGIVLNKKINDYVNKSDILCYLYVNDEFVDYKKIYQAFEII